MASLLTPEGLRNASIGIRDAGDYFSPVAASRFDFTPSFEEIVLSIIPSGLLLLAVPYRLITLRGQRRKVAQAGVLNSNKQTLLAVFAAMHLALLILRALNSSLRTSFGITAAALTFIGSLGLCALSSVEHIRSLRPSPIINCYLLLTLVFDIARVRTLFITDTSGAFSSCFASMMAVKVLVLLAESIEKRSILLPPYRDLSPEETSGIYSRSFFFWLNQLMTTGFHRLLSNDDLYPVDSGMSSVVLQNRIQRAWGTAVKGSPRALFKAVLSANRKALAHGIIPRLFQIGFRYAQPFLLTRTVAFASDISQSQDIGWGLTGAFFFVFLGLAVSKGFYYHMTYKLVTSIRGGLVSIIYSKTVDLSVTALDESAAVTLMSNDVQAICLGFENVHEFWAVPVELVIALYLLERQLGVACVAPAFLAGLSTVGITLIAKFMNRAQTIWMESIQTRVDITAGMLGSMKSVKMLGFTDWLNKSVQNLRITELIRAKLFRQLLIVRAFFGNILITLGPFVTLAIFATQAGPDGRVLSAELAYTALTLIALLAWPVNTLIRAVPMMNAAMASLNRVQAFLESDFRQDHRIPVVDNPTSRSPGVVPREDVMELRTQNISAPSCDPNIIAARNVSFSWSQDDGPIVRDATFNIPRGKVSLIIGPAGCGKSTLLKGILGETPSTKGFLYSDSREAAYVDQTPWIRNTTVRDNILGVSPYDDAWYKEVVRICSLDYDIAELPNGHCKCSCLSCIPLLRHCSDKSRVFRHLTFRRTETAPHIGSSRLLA